MYIKKKKKEGLVIIVDGLFAKDTFFIIVYYIAKLRKARGNKKEKKREKRSVGLYVFRNIDDWKHCAKGYVRTSLVAEAILLLDYKIVRHSAPFEFFLK